MTELSQIAPALIAMAHRIVWCTTATADANSHPRTRVLHPIWEWADGRLTGWIATSPFSAKAVDLAIHPEVSLTYWGATHDTCTADCYAVWEESPAERRAGWDRFANAPAPVGYDPAIIPPWTAPDAEAFGILRLEPRRLRVMPGSVMLAGRGDLLTWKA
ncbi:MAG: pyridoxamine 5'-phosphate oxidase family protein [Actinomycetota bacterium]|nr:pyridoxamine 5'-phosphate oxidase family protein [Actinomycetota bacterium]